MALGFAPDGISISHILFADDLWFFVMQQNWKPMEFWMSSISMLMHQGNWLIWTTVRFTLDLPAQNGGK